MINNNDVKSTCKCVEHKYNKIKKGDSLLGSGEEDVEDSGVASLDVEAGLRFANVVKTLMRARTLTRRSRE